MVGFLLLWSGTSLRSSSYAPVNSIERRHLSHRSLGVGGRGFSVPGPALSINDLQGRGAKKVLVYFR